MSGTGKGLSEFIAEATEIVDTLERDLAALDERPGAELDPDAINAIFRGAHSLKGLAGLFAQERVSALAHHGEELLDRLRLGKAPLTPALLSLLYELIDVLRLLLTEAARGEVTGAVSERGEALGRRLAGREMAVSEAERDPLGEVGLEESIRRVLTEYEEHRLRENLRRGARLYRLAASFSLEDFEQGLLALKAQVKPVGEVVSTLPSPHPQDPSRIAFQLLIASAQPLERLEEAVGAGGRLTQMGPPESGPARARSGVLPPPRALEPQRRLAKEEPESSLRSLTQTVRVDIRRLDALMNAVGELLLIKANVQRLADIARQGNVHVLSKAWAQELLRESHQLQRKLDELQKGLLEARMVPLRQVFDKLSRLVRRIARDSGREIELSVGGGDVELDKLIVEELSDPLMHLIRNAIDHGMGSAEERLRLGKPRGDRRGRRRAGHRREARPRGRHSARAHHRPAGQGVGPAGAAAAHLPARVLDGPLGVRALRPWGGAGRGEDEHRQPLRPHRPDERAWGGDRLQPHPARDAGHHPRVGGLRQ